MRAVLGGNLHWVAFAIGILTLAFGLSISVWQLRHDESAAKVEGKSQARPVSSELELELPDLPARHDTASNSATSDPQMAEPPVQRSGTGDVASVQDGAELVVRDAQGNIKLRETAR